MQSGVGWNEREFKLEVEPLLWENLGISFGTKFLKFKKKRFPLYDTLGDLYHRHIAEGHFNFTSTAEQPLKPDVTDIESDDDGKEMDDEGGLQNLEQSEVEQVQGTQRRAEVEQVQDTQRRAEVEQVQGTQRRAEVEQVQGTQEQANQRRAEVAGPSKIKPNKPKKSPKKSSADDLVGVMERFVKIKEKEANHEATQNFTITKCIAKLRNLEGFDPAQKPRAFAVFKSEKNREIFLNAVGDKDGSALAWLQMEMDK